MFIESINITKLGMIENVEFNFNRHFQPKIFPVGGVNGSGKSTLLYFLSLLKNKHINRIFRVKDIDVVFDIFDGKETIKLSYNNPLCIELFKNTDIIKPPYNIKFEISVNSKIVDAVKHILKKDVTPVNKFNGKYIPINVCELSEGEWHYINILYWCDVILSENAESVILIDDIERSLHPDWQFEIGRDLRDLFPETQFIVATHSYEFCNIVTPAHVKELENNTIQ